MQNFAKSYYPDSKADLFTMFMERALFLVSAKGFMGMINMQAWMFLSSYERLRGKLIDQFAIVSMAHLGARGFDTIGGEVVSTTAFVFLNARDTNRQGSFLRLVEGRSEAEKSRMARQAIANSGDSNFFLAGSRDFLCIPGAPIAYWIGPKWSDAFRQSRPLGEVASASEGIKTGNNGRFLRFWFEIQHRDSGDTTSNTAKWVYHLKGGEYRRWHGNLEYVILWKDNGRTVKDQPNSGIQGEAAFNRDAAIWSDITSGGYAARLKPQYYLFDSSSPAGFLSDSTDQVDLLGFLNSKIAGSAAPMLNPTLHFKVGNFRALPYKSVGTSGVKRLVSLSKSDWDAFETSWNFTSLSLLSTDYRGETLEAAYFNLRAHWQSMTDEMQRLEEQNNRIFINSYSLQDELTPEVPIEEITLTCNPAYRYGVKVTEENRETRLRADTVAEFLSYAVGCMFGRYSLDEPGLILANHGETLANYLVRVPDPSFMPDKDNVIPVLDGDWFADDITERFRQFLRVTFGEMHFRENLKFIEDSLGKDIRRYFTKDFYADHVKRYKKRPIYWMFSSPKGTFNALIYMHRYKPDTVSVMLNDYLREFISKLEAERGRLEKLSDDPSANQAQRTKALKEVAVVAKQIDELTEWERDVVFPLAQAQIKIDIDDGVKANYPKFGAALKKIPGLEDKDD